MYKCPHCGGDVEFIPGSSQIKCPYCESVFSIEDAAGSGEKGANSAGAAENSKKKSESKGSTSESFNAEEAGGGYGENDNLREHLKDKNRKIAEEQILDDAKVYTCSQCGATIFTTEESGVTFCSYCGSQAFLESRMNSEGIKPDVIIPFQITKEKCEELYRNKIKSAWFLPKEMKAESEIKKFRGIYMPFWVYEGEAKADGSYQTTKITREGIYDVHSTYKTTIDANASYDGILRDATASLPDRIVDEISPYEMKDAKKFNDQYMAGFYADVGNVPAKAYDDEVSMQIESYVKTDIYENKNIRSKDINAAVINNDTDVDVRLGDANKGFLPVWFLSHKSRNGMMSYAVVNGQTGKIHADLPIDIKKYLILALAIAIPVFVGLTFLTMTPTWLLTITMLLNIVPFIYAVRISKESYLKETGLDDVGLMYVSGGKLRKRYEQTKVRMAGKKGGKNALKTLGIIVVVLICIAVYSLGQVLNMGFIGMIIIVVFIAMVSFGAKKKKASDTELAQIERNVKVPAGERIKLILWPVLGMFIGAMVLILAPAADMYYYGASIICTLVLIVMVFVIVKKQNQLALRKPAQLGKRGGEEDE